MKKLLCFISLILWLFVASTFATDFSLNGLATSELHFIYHGNQFGWTIFFRDTIPVTETVLLNGVSKTCTQQVRWYYYNAARGQRLRPLDADSLTLLKAYNSSYNNLTVQWGLFYCGWSTQAIYGSVSHILWGQQYYIIAGVNYNFIENSYLPTYLQSMLFAGWQTFGHIFDSRGGIASLFGAGLTITTSDGWGGGWWWGGGWGWWWHEEDDIDDGSGIIEIPSYSGLTISGLMVDTPKVPVVQKIPSIINSPYSEEVTQAYLYAYSMGITTQWPIQKSNPSWLLLRKYAAKMISEFAVNVLGKDLDAKKKCTFWDMKNETVEMQRYAKISCQLGIMWLNSDWTANTTFSPNTVLTRAQFGTMLSRLLRWSAYNGRPWRYYTAHLKALNGNGIMKNISSPMMDEKRQNVMIMFYRIANPAE